MTQQNGLTISFKGETYDIKIHDGYVFSTQKLEDILWDGWEHSSEDAEDLDNQIAYYFDDEVFYNKDAKELYEIFNKETQI